MDLGRLEDTLIVLIRKMLLTNLPLFLQLFELLIDALYAPSSGRNTDHNDKYIYVLAYGVSVTERWDGEERRAINTKRLEQTINAIEVYLFI